MEVAGEANHIQHNFLSMKAADKDAQDALVTASKEGLRLWKRARTARGRHPDWRRRAGRGKLGRVGGRRLLATVEPWHGAGVAVYAEKPGAAPWAEDHHRDRAH